MPMFSRSQVSSLEPRLRELRKLQCEQAEKEGALTQETIELIAR